MADSPTDKSDAFTLPSRASGDSDPEKGLVTEDPGKLLQDPAPKYRPFMELQVSDTGGGTSWKPYTESLSPTIQEPLREIVSDQSGVSRDHG